MRRLFRQEALETHQQRLLGDVFLTHPLSFSGLTLFLAGIVIAVIVFVSLGSYARKETVTGFLSPDKGIVKVHAPRIGVVGQLHVREGEFVKQGAALVTLLGERITGSGIAVDSSMLNAVDAQLGEIEVRKTLENRRREAEETRLAAALSGLEAERNAIAGQIGVQRELLKILQTNYDRIRGMVKKGYISSDEYIAREENIFTNKQVLANLLQKHAANSAQTTQTTLALQRLPLESEGRLSELASAEADLVLKKIDLESRRSITITAQVAGEVTALQVTLGTSVNTLLPLLTILPEGGTLEAHLYVPTRAIGFLKIGQEVRLLYDAFDYRRFGVHIGAISDISSAVLSPAETQSDIRITESSYRVIVQLEKQLVVAYGQKFPLQSGMLLRADIILEKRSLFHWLIDPLVSLRGRT